MILSSPFPRISRSTVQQATATTSRQSARQSFRARQTPKFPPTLAGPPYGELHSAAPAPSARVRFILGFVRPPNSQSPREHRSSSDLGLWQNQLETTFGFRGIKPKLLLPPALCGEDLPASRPAGRPASEHRFTPLAVPPSPTPSGTSSPLRPSLRQARARTRCRGDPRVPPAMFDNRRPMTLELCLRPRFAAPEAPSAGLSSPFLPVNRLRFNSGSNCREPSHLSLSGRKHSACPFHSFRANSRHASRHARAGRRRKRRPRACPAPPATGPDHPSRSPGRDLWGSGNAGAPASATGVLRSLLRVSASAGMPTKVASRGRNPG